MNRRQMCKLSGASLGLVAVSAYVGPLVLPAEKTGVGRPAAGLQVLSTEQSEMIRALSRSLLGGDSYISRHNSRNNSRSDSRNHSSDEPSSGGDQGSSVALEAIVHGVDQAIAGLPLAVQDELNQLLGLMGSQVFMAATTGRLWPRSWAAVSPAQVEACLSSWRFSTLSPLRAAYQALHELIMAAWYGQEASWAAISYPGPPWQP